MSRRKLIAVLSCSLICLALVTFGIYWYSEQGAEQRLQVYTRRLEDEDFTVEERSLEDLHGDGTVRIHFFGDFRSFAKQQGISHIYFDRGMHALYFLNPIGDRVEANIFYYK